MSSSEPRVTPGLLAVGLFSSVLTSLSTSFATTRLTRSVCPPDELEGQFKYSEEVYGGPILEKIGLEWGELEFCSPAASDMLQICHKGRQLLPHSLACQEFGPQLI